MVADLVFFVHIDDVSNYTYGSVAGRDGTYFTRHGSAFSNSNNSFTLYSILAGDFQTCDANIIVKNVVTYTERMIGQLQNQSLVNDKILTNGALFNIKLQCVNGYMGIEFFHFLSYRLHSPEDEDGRLSHKRRRENSVKEMRRILHPNLDSE